MTQIHPTAVISDQVELADSVRIGPYAVVNENVEVGDDTEIGAHAIIGRWTRIGASNQIHTGAVIGTDSQDLKYKGGRTFCHIGDRNIIREYVTINRSSQTDEVTLIGDDNFIHAYCHIAHDCILGSRIRIENLTTLAGHVILEDGVRLGSYVGIHQFCRVGTSAAIEGGTKVVKDIPPYVEVAGNPNCVLGLHHAGLVGISPEATRALVEVYEILYCSNRNLREAMELIGEELKTVAEVRTVLEFLTSSQRGVCKNAQSPFKDPAGG